MSSEETNVTPIDQARLQEELIDIYLESTHLVGLIVANTEVGEAKLVWTDEMPANNNLLKLDLLSDIRYQADKEYDKAIMERDRGDEQ